MEDSLEDRVFHQMYKLTVKLLSKMGLDSAAGSNLVLKYINEIMVLFVMGLVLFLLIANYTPLAHIVQFIRLSLDLSCFSHNTMISAQSNTWEATSEKVSVYAIKGRRSRMEDRFFMAEKFDDTNVSIFAVFDGHGGQFAVDFAHENLIKNIKTKIGQLKDIISGKQPRPNLDPVARKRSFADMKDGTEGVSRRKKSMTKVVSSDDSSTLDVTDPDIIRALNAVRPITREVHETGRKPSLTSENVLTEYLNGNEIDYGRLLTNEILAVDEKLVAEAKVHLDIAGTTAIIGIMEGNKLTVANVGDSRGVMCDGKGNAIPLSFDHKPHQMRERKRIKEAGGMVIFDGVWRVSGILATSRALGDYPLKDRRLVIADPDILTFDLQDHKASFLMFATDGLWDTFTNEEAVGFVKQRLDEPHFGAKSITQCSFQKGSTDNITVMVIKLCDV